MFPTLVYRFVKLQKTVIWLLVIFCKFCFHFQCLKWNKIIYVLKCNKEKSIYWKSKKFPNSATLVSRPLKINVNLTKLHQWLVQRPLIFLWKKLRPDASHILLSEKYCNYRELKISMKFQFLIFGGFFVIHNCIYGSVANFFKFGFLKL